MRSKSTQTKLHIGKILGNFGLRLILISIKRGLLRPELVCATESEEAKTAQNGTEFEKRIPLLIACLGCSNNNMVTSALKVMDYIVNWPLRTLKKSLKSIIVATLKLLDALTSSDVELSQSCFGFMAKLLKLDISKILSAEQMRLLLVHIGQHMDASESVTEPLECLLIIIEKKEIRPEIYDLIDRVTELMIRTYNTTIQHLTKKVE